MSQRNSEPQLIAEDLDELIPVLIRKLGEDGLHDETDMLLIRGFRDVSSRQLRQADIDDVTTSVKRVGMTKRNRQRILELFPDLAG